MTTFATQEMRSATVAAREMSSILNDLSSGKVEKIAILRNSQPAGAIITIKRLEHLEALENYVEDLEIARIVEKRSKTPLSEYIPLEKVLAENGM